MVSNIESACTYHVPVGVNACGTDDECNHPHFMKSSIDVMKTVW